MNTGLKLRNCGISLKNDQDDYKRRQKFRLLFDTALLATLDNTDSHDHKSCKENDFQPEISYQFPKSHLIRDKHFKDITKGPAGDHRVVREDKESGDNSQATHPDPGTAILSIYLPTHLPFSQAGFHLSSIDMSLASSSRSSAR